MAETKATADLAFDAFVESYALKYERAADCLSKDRGRAARCLRLSSRALENPADDQPDRKHLRHRAPPHDPIKGLSIQQDGARDCLQTGRGSAEKLAPSRWPQPVAKTRSRCDIQRRDRGHRQADQPSAQNRRRLTGPGRHQNLAIAPAIDRKAIMNRIFAVTVAATAIFATLMSLQKT